MAKLVDKYFSSIDLKAIEAAVKQAESQSSGELAVTIAPRSHHWLWERIGVSSAVAVIAMFGALWLTHQDDWGTYFNFSQAILWGVIGFVVTYVAFRWVFMRPERRRRIVWEHTLEHFGKLTPTSGQTGVLIFVSLEECHSAVVADKAIAEKLPAEYWHTPQGMIMAGLKANKHAEGIIQAIDLIGAELARHFPRRPDDRNELSDSVTIDN
jgi:putative membrane protein